MEDRWGKWIASKCTRYFDSIDDAIDYLNERDYSGKVLRTPEVIIAVCCAYPDGFYHDAVTVADVCYGGHDDTLAEENVPISCDCCST